MLVQSATLCTNEQEADMQPVLAATKPVKTLITNGLLAVPYSTQLRCRSSVHRSLDSSSSLGIYRDHGPASMLVPHLVSNSLDLPSVACS